MSAGRSGSPGRMILIAVVTGVVYYVGVLTGFLAPPEGVKLPGLEQLRKLLDGNLPDMPEMPDVSSLGGGERSAHATGPTIKLASWNIRILSDNSRDDAELEKIAGIMRGFDIVAIQEARDERVLARLREKLPGWEFVASHPVGRGSHTELYAFFWNTSVVDLVGTPFIVDDPSDLLIREPYAGTFAAGEFDFTLCTIHLLFGDSRRERREELVFMDEIVESVQTANGDEQDVILLGDFNFPPDDEGWQLGGWTPLFMPPTKTTVGDVSLYDNIWLDIDNTIEFAGESGVVNFDEEMFPGDVGAAKREVSDHRPVWAVFSTERDDDPDDYGDLRRAALRPAA